MRQFSVGDNICVVNKNIQIIFNNSNILARKKNEHFSITYPILPYQSHVISIHVYLYIRRSFQCYTLSWTKKKRSQKPNSPEKVLIGGCTFASFVGHVSWILIFHRQCHRFIINVVVIQNLLQIFVWFGLVRRSNWNLEIDLASSELKTEVQLQHFI